MKRKNSTVATDFFFCKAVAHQLRRAWFSITYLLFLQVEKCSLTVGCTSVFTRYISFLISETQCLTLTTWRRSVLIWLMVLEGLQSMVAWLQGRSVTVERSGGEKLCTPKQLGSREKKRGAEEGDIPFVMSGGCTPYYCSAGTCSY